MRGPGAIAAAGIAVIAGAACGDQRAPVDASPRTCPALCAPYLCDPAGHCLTTCGSSDDCTATHSCDRGFCIGMECTPETAAVCGGYACVLGICSTDCAASPCAEGYYCRGDTHACVLRCTTLEDASCAGYVCDVGSGECESYCLDGELPCATGYVCGADQRCTPA